MKKGLDAILIESVCENLQYQTQKTLESYYTYSGALYRYEDEVLPVVAYGAPYASWMYNTNLTGAVPPSIVGYPNGISGMQVDYENGRFLLPSSFPDIPLTGIATVNEINFYLSNKSAAQLICETKFEQAPVMAAANTYFPPYNYIVPAVFVKSFKTNNEDYSLGGQVWSIFNLQVICLMPSELYLASIGGIIRDMNQRMIPLLDFWPLNQMGDFRELDWNYENYAKNAQYLAYVSDSTFKIEEPDVFNSQNPKLYVGIGHIEVRIVRTPRNPNSDPKTIVYATTDEGAIFTTDDDINFALS